MPEIPHDLAALLLLSAACFASALIGVWWERRASRVEAERAEVTAPHRRSEKPTATLLRRHRFQVRTIAGMIPVRSVTQHESDDQNLIAITGGLVIDACGERRDSVYSIPPGPGFLRIDALGKWGEVLATWQVEYKRAEHRMPDDFHAESEGPLLGEVYLHGCTISSSWMDVGRILAGPWAEAARLEPADDVTPPPPAWPDQDDDEEDGGEAAAASEPESAA